MGLKTFKTDSNLLTEGVWFEFPSANEDGTVARFRLRAMGDFNVQYARLMTKKYKPLQKLIQANALPTEKREKAQLELVQEYVLADWQNMQPLDDGQDLAFTDENVKSIVEDPDWRALVNWIVDNASELSNYGVDSLKDAAKN